MADELNLSVERERFEANERKRGSDLRLAYFGRDGGEYAHPAVEKRWQDWIAERSADKIRTQQTSAQEGGAA